MNRQRYLTYACSQLVFILIITMTQIGCASRNQIADLRLNSADYNQVFDATKQVVRSTGYLLDRVDRRFGIITSQPQDAGSILEPWRDLSATPEQTLDATFNYEQRIIRINFIPASGSPAGPPPQSNANNALAQIEPEAHPGADEISSYKGTLRIDVQVIIERAHHPGRRIETTSLRRSSYTIDPTLAKRGIPAKFWEVVARDPYLEQDIMKRITRKLPGTIQVELINRNPIKQE